MKRDYSKWCSVALIAAIYALAGVAGWLLFDALAANPLTANPLIRLFLADVLATIVVWAFGVLYEMVCSCHSAAYRFVVLGLAPHAQLGYHVQRNRS